MTGRAKRAGLPLRRAALASVPSARRCRTFTASPYFDVCHLPCLPRSGRPARCLAAADAMHTLRLSRLPRLRRSAGRGRHQHQPLPARRRRDAARAGKTPRRRTQAARSRLWRTGTAHACGDRRNALYRLSQMPRCVSGGRHRGRAPAHAHGDRFRVQRLRAVCAALSGGLHRLGTVFGARGSRAVAGLCAGRNHALRARTERRLARLARRTKTRTTRRGSIFPDRDTIRRDIAAALERAKRKNFTGLTGLRRIYRIKA